MVDIFKTVEYGLSKISEMTGGKKNPPSLQLTGMNVLTFKATQTF